MALSGFSAESDSQVLYNTVTDSQSEGVNEPILLATADGNRGLWRLLRTQVMSKILLFH